MILFIYFCILILNVLTIFLTYRFLGNELEKKEKFIFIAVGIAIIYMLVSAVYWLSTKNLDLGQASETAKNLITFAFVPVNGILILPFLAGSYKSFKMGALKPDKFRNRCILLGVILVVLLLMQFFYFKDIQTGILNIIQART